MKGNFRESMDEVLKWEGGFVDCLTDTFQSTNKGIPFKTYQRIFGVGKSLEDLENITDSEIALIYRSVFWNGVEADRLPSGLDYAVFDAAVSSGPEHARRLLQQTVGVTPSGTLTELDRAKIQVLTKTAEGVRDMIAFFSLNRLGSLRTMFEITWSDHCDHWTRRVNEVMNKANGMTSYFFPDEGPIEPSAVKLDKNTIDVSEILGYQEFGLSTFLVPGVNALCGNCAYRAAYHSIPERSSGGTCRLNPPVPGAGWPKVRTTDWCSQWAPKCDQPEAVEKEDV